MICSAYQRSSLLIFVPSRLRSAARITRTPVLLIENEADDNVPASHGPTIFRSLGGLDKEMVSIQGATHYYFGQPTQLRECLDYVISWSRRKELLV